MNEGPQSNVIQMSNRLVEMSRQALNTSDQSKSKTQVRLEESRDFLMQHGIVDVFIKMQSEIDILKDIVEDLVVRITSNQDVIEIDELIFDKNKDDSPSRHKIRADMCISAATKREQQEFTTDRTAKTIDNWISEINWSHTNYR